MTNSVFNAKKAMIAVVLILSFFLNASMAQASFTLEDEKKLGKEFYEKLHAKPLLKNPRNNDYANRVVILSLPTQRKPLLNSGSSSINIPCHALQPREAMSMSIRG
jgi:hypothetical protein